MQMQMEVSAAKPFCGRKATNLLILPWITFHSPRTLAHPPNGLHQPLNTRTEPNETEHPATTSAARSTTSPTTGATASPRATAKATGTKADYLSIRPPNNPLSANESQTGNTTGVGQRQPQCHEQRRRPGQAERAARRRRRYDERGRHAAEPTGRWHGIHQSRLDDEQQNAESDGPAAGRSGGGRRPKSDGGPGQSEAANGGPPTATQSNGETAERP